MDLCRRKLKSITSPIIAWEEAMLILLRDRLFNGKIRAKLPVIAHCTLRADIQRKPAFVPVLIQFELEFGEHKYLPTSQAFCN